VIAVGAAVTATALLLMLGAGTRLLRLPLPTLIGVLAGM
jgi:predicted PurR-regulated permease PerM